MRYTYLLLVFMIAMVLDHACQPLYAGVQDGQPVSAAITNAAFMDKNTTTTFTTALADIRGGVEVSTAADSTSTGTAQNITLSAPITTFTNGSLVSIQNLVFTNRTDATYAQIRNKTGGTLTLKNLSGGTAANQIDTGTGADLPLADDASVSLFYNTVSSKWQVLTAAGADVNASNIASGILAIAHGGTGVNTVTNTPTASAWAGWDGSANLFANNFNAGYATTATNGGTTTLNFASAEQQYFTGSSNQIVTLPAVTLLFNGELFRIVNNSSGVVTVKSSGANTLQAMAANTELIAMVKDNTAGTGTAAWSWRYAPMESSALGVAVGGTGANLSSTGGTSQVLKQTSSGGAVTVGQLACADLSNGAASCSTDTTNASNISSGTLNASRLPSLASGSNGVIQLSNGSGAFTSFSGMYATSTDFYIFSGTTSGDRGLDIGVGNSSFVNIQGTLGDLSGAKKIIFNSGGGDVQFGSSSATDTFQGTVALPGSSSGTISLKTQAAAGTYNWNWPITAGSSGQVLTSQGGSTTAMTWSTVVTDPTSSKGDLIVQTGSPSLAALSAGANYKALEANSAATNGLDYETISGSAPIVNCSITASVGSNILTVALKDNAGSDASSSSICKIPFRSATLTTGTYTVETVSGSLSVAVADTVSMGCVAASPCTLWVYAIDNGGTVELGLIDGTLLDEGAVQTSSAISGGTAYGTLYSTTARTSKAVRLLGRVNVTPAASFHWSNAPTSIANVPVDAGVVRQSSLLTFKIEAANIAAGTSISAQTGSPKWISSLTNNATGDSTLTLVTGVFAASPYCICTAYNDSTPNGRVCKVRTASSSAVRVVTTIDSTDAAAAENYDIICFGQG